MPRGAARKKSDRPKSEAGRRLGWGLIVVVCLVWSFVLGILVGQGNLANRDQLDQLAEQARGWPLVGVLFEPEPAEAPQPADKIKLEFYDKLQNEAEPETPPPAATPKKPAKPKQAPAGEAKPTETTDRRYTVQVASFADQAQAVELATRLRSGGLNSYVLATNLKGVGMRYRVRVGEYQDFDQAQAVAGRIRLEEKLAAFVTRK